MLTITLGKLDVLRSAVLSDWGKVSRRAVVNTVHNDVPTSRNACWELHEGSRGHKALDAAGTGKMECPKGGSEHKGMDIERARD